VEWYWQRDTEFGEKPVPIALCVIFTFVSIARHKTWMQRLQRVRNRQHSRSWFSYCPNVWISLYGKPLHIQHFAERQNDDAWERNWQFCSSKRWLRRSSRLSHPTEVATSSRRCKRCCAGRTDKALRVVSGKRNMTCGLDVPSRNRQYYE